VTATFDPDYGLGPEPDHTCGEPVPFWADSLRIQLDENAAALARIEAILADVAAIAGRVKSELTPFLDGLAKSPLLKMLGVKK
jgi:hypothetical protein